jgi:hypothetical protein
MTRQTFGIGITLSAGVPLAEVGVQRSFVRDGATGSWFYVETTISGAGVGALPASGSLDVFVLSPGRDVHSLSGLGGFTGGSMITAAGLIYNSNGEVIGVQGGFETNISFGGYVTNGTVIPLASAAPAITSLLRDMIGGAIIGAAFGPMGAVGGALGGLVGNAIASPLATFIDPLTLDLDGDGIELTALGVAGQAGASNVFFDFDSDGFAERTGWVKADDGMLALDLNGDGLITSGRELFGQPTRDGYEVLETYDTYADGVIDQKDTIFSQLRVWRDLDQDGVTDAGELKTLLESGVTAISLTRADVTGQNQGNERGFQGAFTRLAAVGRRRRTSQCMAHGEASRSPQTCALSALRGSRGHVPDRPANPRRTAAHRSAWRRCAGRLPAHAIAQAARAVPAARAASS